MIDRLAELPWFYRFIILIITGAMLAIPVIFLPRPRHLRWLGIQPFCSPNWISLWRAPIIAVGLTLFFYACRNKEAATTNEFYIPFLIGFYTSVFGLSLDRVDGRVAKVLYKSLRLFPELDAPSHIFDERWAWIIITEEDSSGEKIKVRYYVIMEPWIDRLMKPYTRLPMFHFDTQTHELKLTGLGETLDPAIDKVNLIPPFLYLAYLGEIWWGIVLSMVISELVSTVMRPPFINWPVFRRLQVFVREVKASFFGKSKVVWQFVSLLIAIPACAGWLNPTERHHYFLTASILLGIGFLAGTLSVWSRLKAMKGFLKSYGLNKFYRRSQKAFEHDVDEEAEQAPSDTK